MKDKSKIIYAELCYKLYGLFYEVHNSLGRYCKEKQYADALEKLLNRENIKYNREFELTFNIAKEEIKRNRVDFLIDNRLLIDTKAKKFIDKSDYFQAKRYLIASDLKLLLIVNFREKYIKSKRILNTLVNE
jgi:GxxExxY protein